MERPLKQARVETGYNHPRDTAFLAATTELSSRPRPFYSGWSGCNFGLTEEEFCNLLREETNESKNGTFLQWLSGYIESGAIFGLSISTVRMLHGWHILQLGGSTITVTVSNMNSNISLNGDPTVTFKIGLLLKNLRNIYLAWPIRVLLNTYELQETMKVHMKHAIQIMNNRANWKDEDSANSLSDCLASIDLLLNAQFEDFGDLSSEHRSPDDQFKDFILALLGTFRMEKNDDSSSVNKLRASQVLLKLSNAQYIKQEEAPDAICACAAIALSVAEFYEQCRKQNISFPTNTLWPTHAYRSQLQRLFHIECIAHFGFWLPEDIGESVENELVRIALEGEPETLSPRAARCLIHLATKIQPNSSTLKHKMIQIFTSANHKIRIQVLMGVASKGTCATEKEHPDPFVAICIETRDEQIVKAVVAALVDLILTVNDNESLVLNGEFPWREVAAYFLRNLLTYVCRDAPELISQSDILSISITFLRSSIPEAIRCSIDTTYDLVLSGALHIHDVHELFNSLVSPLLSLSCDVQTKTKAVTLIEVLTRQRYWHLSQLLRIPRALEGLVRCLSNVATYSDEPTSFTRRLKHRAISIILNMAEDPVNLRIMAKQTGLLSVLIRYIREEEFLLDNLNQEGEENDATDREDGTTLPEKHAVKQTILRIAAAL